MDCLLQTKVCEGSGLCSDACCENLVCRLNGYENPKLQKAFYEQSNYYRGLIALQCPLNACKTRAQFFSEQNVNSPIYDSRCDQLHLTTILTDQCSRVIQEYCTSNMGSETFVDHDVCTQFINSNSLFTTHDWNTECEFEINQTKAGNYPAMDNICYYVVIQECISTGECPCVLKKFVNDTTIQLIPCLFNECSPQIEIGVLNVSVVIIILFFYIILEYNKILR